MAVLRTPAFKKDPATGLAIPQIELGQEWILANDNTRVGMMVEGIHVRVTTLGPNYALRRRIIGQNCAYWVEARKDITDDKVLFDAVERAKPMVLGTYIVLGPGIDGNPHHVDALTMLRIEPYFDHKLLVYLEHGLPVGSQYRAQNKNATPEMLYNAIKRELSHPECDVSGVEFMIEVWEKGACMLAQHAYVTKQSMGIEWPQTVDTTLPQTTKEGLIVHPGHQHSQADGWFE